MAEKQFSTRIQQKHDYDVNWHKAKNFIPKPGEIIVYDAEIDQYGNIIPEACINKTISDGFPNNRTTPWAQPRFKVGDGIQNINNLPFSSDLIKIQVDFISYSIGDQLFEIGNNGTPYLKIGNTVINEAKLIKLLELLEDDEPTTPPIENYAMANNEQLLAPNGELLIIGKKMHTDNPPEDTPSEPEIDNLNYAMANNEKLEYNDECVIIE